ncbi:MAG: VanZ family protein [Clostridia bacterium]|nr:VanZ family protein [Clostridia bacterium]
MKKITKIAIVIAVVIILAFIFSNSILTKRQSNGLSKGIYDTFSPYLSKVLPSIITSENGHLIVRKAAHFLEFFALGIFLYLLISLLKEPYKSQNKSQNKYPTAPKTTAALTIEGKTENLIKNKAKTTIKNKVDNRYFATFLIGVIVAFFDEGLQILTNRGNSISDVMLDVLGVFFAITLIYALNTVIKRLSKQK